jgi:hypothetical protein
MVAGSLGGAAPGGRLDGVRRHGGGLVRGAAPGWPARWGCGAMVAGSLRARR